MKRALPLTFAAILLATPALAQNLGLAADATRRLQLAGQAVTINPPQDAILNSGLTAHPMFQQIYDRLDKNRLNLLAAQLMAQTFTQQELAALVQFQTSPAGRSIQNKMPAYQKMLGALIQNEFTTAFQGYVGSQAAAGAGGASGLRQPTAPTPPTAPAGGLTGTGSPLR